MTINNSDVTKKEFVNQYRLIKSQLNKLFFIEFSADDSILLSYSVDFIERLAKYLLTDNQKSVSIGIAGETASGKSTITYDLIDVLNDYSEHYNLENLIARINSDDYYYDRSKMVKDMGGFDEFVKVYDLDVPQALELNLMRKHIHALMNKKEVYLPKYDLSGTAIRIDNCQFTKPSRIIISEGLFVLTDAVKDAFDFKIYVETPREVQKKRFFIRAKERGMVQSADLLYNKALDRAQTHILPTKDYADIVLSGEADRSRYKIFLTKLLGIVEQIHHSE